MSDPTLNALSQGFLAGHAYYKSISQNEVNGQNPDYVRTRTTFQTTHLSTDLSGVLSKIERCSDPITFKNLSRSRVNWGCTSVLSDFHYDVQVSFGSVGEEALNLAGRTQTFFQRIQTPQQAPNTPAYLNSIMQDAHVLAQEYNRVSDIIQGLRNKADQEIFTTITRINTLLHEYHALNKDIGFSHSNGGHAFAAEDKRDALVLELSSYLSVTESIDYQEEGFQSAVKHLYGPDGIALVTRNHVSQLAFFRGGNINAHTSFENGQLSGIEVVCEKFTDNLTPLLTSGKLGGWFKMRDSILPRMHDVLDQMAATFQDRINDIHNQGAAYHTPHTLMSGHRLDQTMTWDKGTLRVAITHHTDGTIIDFLDIDLSKITTLQDLIKEFHTLNNVACTWQDGRLTITVAGAKNGIAFRGLDEKASRLLTQINLNPLFVSDPQRAPQDQNVTGISSAISVNPLIFKDPRLMAHGILSQNPKLQVGETALQQADWRNLVALGQSGEDQWDFAESGDLAPQNLTLFDYARLFLTHTAQQAATSKNIFQVAETGLQVWEDRLHEAQSVDDTHNRLDQLRLNEYIRNVMQTIVSFSKLNSELLDLLRTL